MKAVLRICLLLFVLCAAGAAYVWREASVFLSTPAEVPGSEVYFDVPSGARLGQVARLLQEKGIITDAYKFGLLARWEKWQNRLQAGCFALHTGWLPERILNELVNGKPVLYRVTVAEGLTWWQTGRLLEDAGFVSFEAFQAIVTNADFLRHYGIPFASAEGFLMPDTYFLRKPGTGDAPPQVPKALLPLAIDLSRRQALAVAGRLVDNFWRRAAAVWPEGRRPEAPDLKKWVILASIVERETAVEAERPRVAGVYANRLARSMLLQADPTVIYGLGMSFDGNLRRKHLEEAGNPYNTYQRPGLPPGPICSFGLSALRAAIRPEPHSYLYFVAKTDGGEHVFSSNLSEHNRAVRQYLQSRRRRGN